MISLIIIGSIYYFFVNYTDILGLDESTKIYSIFSYIGVKLILDTTIEAIFISISIFMINYKKT